MSLTDNQQILSQLSRLLKTIDNKIFIAVFGGFAIDAHCGSCTRFHEDVDMICWRKDINIVRQALETIGFGSEIITHHQETDLEYIIKTTDSQKIFSFQIADRLDENNFEISFWPFIHVKFPLSYLDIELKRLENITFPVVKKPMLIDLKQKQAELYERTKHEDIEKYLAKQKDKHDKALRDLKLLN